MAFAKVLRPLEKPWGVFAIGRKSDGLTVWACPADAVVRWLCYSRTVVFCSMSSWAFRDQESGDGEAW